MDKRFSPKPNRFGTEVSHVNTGVLTSPTANTTTTYDIPVPFRKCWVERIYGAARTVPVDADGTLLATFKKYVAATDADTTLNTAATTSAATGNLELLVTKEVTNFTIDPTLSDAQRILQEGDTIRVEVVSNSAAIDTAAVGLFFGVELLPLE